LRLRAQCSRRFIIARSRREARLRGRFRRRSTAR